MQKATAVARRILLGSAGLALALGLIVGIGHAYALIGLHELAGYTLVASLWALAAIAARSRVPIGLVVGAVGWGVLVLTIGWSQEFLLTGSWHWVVRVMHPVISMTCVPWGRRLATLIGGTSRGAEPASVRSTIATS